MSRSTVQLARILGAIAVTTVTGCASGVSPAHRTESTYIPGAGLLSITGENGTISAVLGARLESAWRMLPIAFDSVGVQLSLIDPKKYLMANEGFRIRQKLGKERLSTYFECGTTQVGPNADSYEMYITVHSNLTPVKGDSTRTRMTVAITAVAKPLQFAQDYSRCTSKTILERKMLDIMASALK